MADLPHTIDDEATHPVQQSGAGVDAYLTEHARAAPDRTAIVVCEKRDRFRSISFAQLDSMVDEIARGLPAAGCEPGMRIVLLVPCGIEFVAGVFAMLRAGITMVLVDPGMGRKHVINCLAAVEPDGFFAIPKGQMARLLYWGRFPLATHNITVGRRLGWGGRTLNEVRELGRQRTNPLPPLDATADAAIVFTSGSTGPPKGVLYQQQTFLAQAEQIRDFYGIQPGGIDLACFPLFGLFNVAMGVTTVFPEMDFSRPATADPKKLLSAANRWQVTQAFASPAVWKNLGRYAGETDARIPTLRHVFSCGAPVPADVLKQTLSFVHPEAQMHTPYGATESLPVSSIEAQSVLEETTAKTDGGAGVCVGERFPNVDLKVIAITDEPIEQIAEAREVATGEIGELIVAAPQVSRRYVTAPSANATTKIQDGARVWHRMGDVGYFDDRNRFWYCGRKSHRVVLRDRTLFTIPVEAIFNTHPQVERSALVRLDRNEETVPVVWLELANGVPSAADRDRLLKEMRDLASRNTMTQGISLFAFIDKMPVDVRHNAKIHRESLTDRLAREYFDSSIDDTPLQSSRQTDGEH